MIVCLTKALKLHNIIKRHSGNGGKKTTDLVRRAVGQNNNSMILPPASNQNPNIINPVTPRIKSTSANPQAMPPQNQRAPAAQEQKRMYEAAKADPNKVLQKMRQEEEQKEKHHRQRDDAVKAIIAQQERNKLKKIEQSKENLEDIEETRKKFEDIEEAKRRIIKTVPIIISTILKKVACQEYVAEHDLKALLQYVRDNPACLIKLSANMQEQEKIHKRIEGLDPTEDAAMMKELCKNMIYIPKNLYEKYILYIKNPTTVFTEADQELHEYLKAIFNPRRTAFVEKYLGNCQDYNTLPSYFTLQDKKNRVIFCSQLKKKIETNNINATELLIILEESNVVCYPDVSYKGLYLIYDEKSKTLVIHNEKEIFKEGEGLKLTNTAYSLVTNPVENSVKTSSMLLTERQLYEIQKQIKNKQCIVGILRRPDQELKNAVVITGNDLHFLCVVEDVENPEYFIGLYMLTSTNDTNTKTLSKTQEFNANLNESKKPQNMRAFTKPIRIRKEHFEKHISGTEYITSINKEGDDVHKKIEEILLATLKNFIKNPIEGPLIVTEAVLLDLAKESLKQEMAKLTKDITKREKKPEFQQKKEEKEAEIQKAKMIKEQKEQKFKDSLNINEAQAYRIKLLLEEAFDKLKNPKKISINEKLLILSEEESILNPKEKTPILSKDEPILNLNEKTPH